MELKLKLDRRNLARFRTLMKANKTMAAKSLTKVAYEARDDWREEIPEDFHLRRKWLISGARTKMATAKNLQSAVGHMDSYFGRHVKGVDEPKRAAGSKLFVPAQPAEEQPSHTGIRAMMRRAAKSKTPPFRVRDAILRRVGRKSDGPIRLLGVLRREVAIEPRFDALGLTERAVQREFGKVYSHLLKKWARTGKG